MNGRGRPKMPNGARNAAHAAVQPVTTVVPDAAVWAAVKVILGPGGDYRRAEVITPMCVKVHTRPPAELAA